MGRGDGPDRRGPSEETEGVLAHTPLLATPRVARKREDCKVCKVTREGEIFMFGKISNYGWRTLSLILVTCGVALAVTARPAAALATRLVVSSEFSHSILRYDGASGAFVDTFVPSGSGGLDQPTGVTQGPDGNFYVSSKGSGQILRFSKVNGSFLGVFAYGGGLTAPFDLAFGPDGNLYVAHDEAGAGGVVRYHGVTGAPLPAPGKTGAVFVPAGNIEGARGLAFGPDGNLYASSLNSGSVLRFSAATGASLGPFASQGMSGPHMITFGPGGNLYVSSADSGSVQRYNGTTGAFLDDFVTPGSGGLSDNLGLAFGPDGALYVSSSGNDNVLRFHGGTGAFLGVFVPAGMGGVTHAGWMTFAPAYTIPWSGVLQPVNIDGSSIFKLGSTVPVKFKLTGAGAGITNLVAKLSVVKISSNIVGSEPEPVSSNPASTGNTFRYDATTGEYIYNLGTKGTSWTAGTYQLRIDLGDGDTTRTVNISLR
jgi:streptogramin lyase